MNLLLQRISLLFNPIFSSALIKPLIYSFALNAKPHKKPQVQFKKWTIIRGDVVKIITGKDKAKVGKVTKVWRKSNRITVRGVNIKLKLAKNPQNGSTITKRKAYPIHVSNAGLYDSQSKKAVRIRLGFHPQTGDKLRISKASGKILKRPVHKNLTRQRRGKKKTAGAKDTTADTAHKVTYQGQDFQLLKKQFDKFIAQKEEREKYLVFKE